MTWSAHSHDLQYDIRHANACATLRLAGELDLASRPIAERALAQASSASAETILDLSRVTFMDGQGLHFLLMAQRDARAAGHRLIIRRPHRAVRRLLELTGALSLLKLDGASNGDVRPVLSRDMAAICARALDKAMRLDRTDADNIQVLDESAGGLRIIAQHGFNRDFLDFFEIVDEDDSACGRAMKSAGSVWVPETVKSPIFAGTPALEVMLDAGSRAVASIPILSPNGRLMAMISTHHRRRQAWTDQRKHELEQLARSTGRLLQGLTPNRRPPGPRPL